MEFKGKIGILLLPTSININRIKVEFKAWIAKPLFVSPVDINRIKVEFKGLFVESWRKLSFSILIESKWNLKHGQHL